MNANKRNGRISRLGRLATVLGAGLAFALTTVPDAWAGHRNDDSHRSSRYQDRDHRSRNHPRVVTVERSSKHHRHSKHERRRHPHRKHYAHHGAGHHAYGHGQPRRARVVRVHEHGRYYCKPCRHYFGSRHDFHGHLHHHHRVPLWKLPFVIVHSTIGWIFHG